MFKVFISMLSEGQNSLEQKEKLAKQALVGNEKSLRKLLQMVATDAIADGVSRTLEDPVLAKEAMENESSIEQILGLAASFE